MAQARVQTAQAAQLDAWRALFKGCTRIQELQPRQNATVVGVVQRIRLVPGDSLETVVTDGTGRLRAIWTGSEILRGLELGRGLRLQGTVSSERGTALMRNPTWCLVRDPYACNEERG